MHVTVRMSEQQLAKLDSLAEGLGVDRSSALRGLIDAADVAGVPALGIPSTEELLGVLAARARAGNVSAIRTLLARGDLASEIDVELERLLR